jgi:phage gp36-like protein
MYATQPDMLTAYGTAELVQLTDIEQPRTGAVVGAVLDAALTAASAEIDGYLIGRYALPLASPPAILNGLCCKIARYRLMTTAPDEVARKGYEDAVRYLELVARGQVNLIAPADVPAAAGAGSVLFEPGAKIFGRESAAGDAAGA